MIYLQITTDPVCYGPPEHVTESEARDAAEKIADHASSLFPDAEFEVVLCSPREACLDGEEDRLAEIKQVIEDNWADWIS